MASLGSTCLAVLVSVTVAEGRSATEFRKWGVVQSTSDTAANLIPTFAESPKQMAGLSNWKKMLDDQKLMDLVRS